jgi:hypothetical protein
MATAVAAGMLIGTPALAVAGSTHAKHPRKHAVKHHVVIIKHVTHHVKAFVASCPPGQSSPSYCTPPVVDSLYETFNSATTASIKVSTSVANELLVAFVGSDGPKAGGQSSTVSGGGLTWHKVAAESQALGDAEVWYAVAPSTLKSQAITATAAKTGYDENMNIMTFKNASGIGASGIFYSSKGAPTGTITTTHTDGWVWASGMDFGGSAKRVAPSNQNIWEQTLDNTAKKAFWTQSTNNVTTNAGTSVTLNDTSPTGDPFDLVMVEVF